MPKEITAEDLEQMKLAACRKYIAAGLVVHPLSKPDDKGISPGKRPLISGWQELTATPDDIGGYIRQGCNLGLVCGKASNITAIDLDDDLFIPELLNGVEVRTLMSSRTNGRGHLYFRYNPGLPASKNHELCFEVMSDGNNLVMPPSVHKTGDVYRWGCEDKKYSIDEIGSHLANLPDIPQKLIENINNLTAGHAGVKAAIAKSRHCFRDILKRKPDMHGADGREYMLAVCTDLKAGGADEEHVKIFAKLMYGKDFNEERTLQEWRNIDAAKTWQCDTLKAKLPSYLSVEECDKCERRRQDKRNGELKGNCACAPYHKTDLGNGKRLVDMYGENIRFCYPWKSWEVWNGKRWDSDKLAVLRGFARQVVGKIYDDANAENDFEERKRLLLFAIKSESASSINNMIELAQSEEGIPILPEAFDINPWLFNVQNGTLDLKTGSLRPHAQNDLMTKISPVTYDPNAKCPRWMEFLNTIFNNSVEMIDYIQKQAGYALTGDTSEEDFCIHYGTGGNGKSKFNDEIAYIMGDYFIKANVETILHSKNTQSGSAASGDVARLAGARLVVASEPERGAELKEGLIKDLTGREQITARRLYEREFQYKPTFKFWLITNHKPNVKSQDKGMWRRLKMTPFEVTIPDDQIDKNLDVKLKAESAGILNWMIEGCLKWQREGIQTPKEVIEATTEYKDDMDTLGEFFRVCCVFESKNAKTPNKWLYNWVYLAWCELTNSRVWSQKTFTGDLQSRGYKNKRLTTGMTWLGIGLNLHILEKCSDLETQASDGFNVGMQDMLYFLETFVNSPSYGKFPEIPTEPSHPTLNTPIDSGVAYISQKGNVGCTYFLTENTEPRKNPGQSKQLIEVKTQNQITHLTKIIIDASQEFGQFNGFVNSSNIIKFSVWLVEKYKPQWQENGNSGYYTPSAIKGLAAKILKITPEPAPQETTTPGT